MNNIKYIVLSLFNIFLIQSGNAQNQKIADSLIIELKMLNEGNDSLRFSMLHFISFNHNNPDSALYYANVLKSEALKTNHQKHLNMAYFDIGSALRLKGDLHESIAAYFKSADIAKILKDSIKLANAYSGIADVYSESGASENSISYYNKAIFLLRIKKDSTRLASTLLNAGDELFYKSELDSALLYFKESRDIFNLKNYPIGIAYSLGNIGMIYAQQDKDVQAEKNISEAIVILEEIKDYYPVSVYLTYMSDIYAKKQDWVQAFDYANRSLELAMLYGLKDQISDSYLQLHELNELRGMAEESLKNYKNHIVYRDSVTNIAAIQEMANLRTNFEVSQKQTEVNLLDQQKKNQQLISLATGIGLLLIMVLAIGLYRRNKFINKAKQIIEKEKDRSDSLLLNILPEQTAEELKDNGKVKAKRFDSVSVMFTDFKGFTSLSDRLSPEELVNSIDFYYSKFDDIIEKHGLEKIKTVGDAYMCAGGLPFPTENHPIQMLKAALEIGEFVNETKKADPEASTRFDIRIGINTGPVVAGIVGKKKFAYDIWGDTVNIASRMESNSQPGKVNISDNTFQLVKDQYNCMYRGEIEVKNKGMMKMYFVDGLIQKQTSTPLI